MDIKMKKGQISIFIIVGVMLIGAVVLFFLVFSSGDISIGKERDFNAESFVSTCIRESVRKNVDIMLPQGGFSNPQDYKLYQDIKVPYLCKNVNYYEPCINQYPRYITSLKEELEDNMNTDMQECFISLDAELASRGYSYNGGDFDIDAILKQGFVEVVVYRDMEISKDGSSQTIKSFSASVSSPLYDLGYVANEIARQEAKYCYFEYVGFSLLYNDFDIMKTAVSDSTKIYSIKDKLSEKVMNIAVRGCAIPAGF